MTTVVVPFAGAAGKTRLDAPRSTRRELSLAMLADVLAATVVVGRTLVVTADGDGATAAREAGAEAVTDPGGGQGPAVQAALAGIEGAALDGTTNALGLSAVGLFAPVYGPDSATRFRALGVETVDVVVPNLAADVDTLADLERLQLRC